MDFNHFKQAARNVQYIIKIYHMPNRNANIFSNQLKNKQKKCNRKQMTEDGRQKTDDSRQMTEYR
jgi:hypothetical protein